MRNYTSIGIQVPEVLLPAKEIDYTKWAIVACDQYTSQPEYWKKAQAIIGDSPSTFWMMLPEAFLGTDQEESHQSRINAHMSEYIDDGVLQPVTGLIYIERTLGDKKRKGLITALDLEEYSFKKGTKSMVRASEGTIIDRLPPRIKIRKKALLEMPHILVLIDDPDMQVVEPLSSKKSDLSPLYNFDLMQDGGHIEGYLVTDKSIEEKIVGSLEKLLDPENFVKKYGLEENETPFLFAVGDGNHSLATAKSVWDEMKSNLPKDHPARYALVEIVNIHDEGILFEPIHRLIKEIAKDPLEEMKNYFNGQLSIEEVPNFSALKEKVIAQKESEQVFGYFDDRGYWVVNTKKHDHTLTVGSVQNFLDKYLAEKGAVEVDYVHGDEAILDLGTSSSNAGFYLPVMQKSQLFETVIKDGELPRKTFSMGEANEKRFYLECRKIQ